MSDTPIPAAMPTKPWWKSRELWFNAAVAIMAALEVSTGLLAQLFTPAVYPRIAIGVAIINAVLRVISAHRLTLK
jgi:hypothetical protein